MSGNGGNPHSLRDLLGTYEKSGLTVATYLRDLIFHDLAKIKPMFKDVLGCDFGDISWLFEAVKIRHHCVHRAGQDKDGNKVDISKESIRNLANRSSNLVHAVETRIDQISRSDLEF